MQFLFLFTTPKVGDRFLSPSDSTQNGSLRTQQPAGGIPFGTDQTISRLKDIPIPFQKVCRYGPLTEWNAAHPPPIPPIPPSLIVIGPGRPWEHPHGPERPRGVSWTPRRRLRDVPGHPRDVPGTSQVDRCRGVPRTSFKRLEVVLELCFDHFQTIFILVKNHFQLS